MLGIGQVKHLCKDFLAQLYVVLWKEPVSKKYKPQAIEALQTKQVYNALS